MIRRNKFVGGQKKRKPAARKLEDKEYRQLVSILDKEFGTWVKRKEQVAEGVSQCITCGGYYDLRLIQAGHYISRRYFATRWEPMNVHSQCCGCNGDRGGDPLRYRNTLVERYGEKEVKALEFKATLGGETRIAREEIIAMIHKYRALNKELR